MIISGTNIGGGSGPLVGWSMGDPPPSSGGGGGSSTQKAIFGYGYSDFGFESRTNLVSNTGVVAADTIGVGTARWQLGAAGYGGDKAIFGYGINSTSDNVSTTNLVSNTGVVATNTTGVGRTRQYLAAASYSA